LSVAVQFMKQLLNWRIDDRVELSEQRHEVIVVIRRAYCIDHHKGKKLVLFSKAREWQFEHLLCLRAAIQSKHKLPRLR
jgi:hypothetical protein